MKVYARGKHRMNVYDRCGDTMPHRCYNSSTSCANAACALRGRGYWARTLTVTDSGTRYDPLRYIGRAAA